jgi:hypothetical protein
MKMRAAIKLIFIPVLLFLLAFKGGDVWNTITVQEYNVAMEKVEKFYKEKKKYAVKVTHATYKGHDSEIPYQQSTGYFHYENGKYHSWLLGIHTIQDGKYKVVVDSVNKMIIVSDPDPKTTDELMHLNYTNSARYIIACKQSKTEDGEKFKLDFNEVPSYTSYLLAISAAGEIRGLTVYYRAEYPSDSKDPNSPKAKPKLSINYSGFTATPVFDAGEFSSAKYFTVEKNKLKATSLYSTYRISDARLTTK